MTNRQIIVALSVALIAAPASAQDAKAGKGATGADQKKYCIQYDNVVGSRVARTECKTKEQWAKERVDVERMLKD